MCNLSSGTNLHTLIKLHSCGVHRKQWWRQNWSKRNFQKEN